MIKDLVNYVMQLNRAREWSNTHNISNANFQHDY